MHNCPYCRCDEVSRPVAREHIVINGCGGGFKIYTLGYEGPETGHPVGEWRSWCTMCPPEPPARAEPSRGRVVIFEPLQMPLSDEDSAAFDGAMETARQTASTVHLFRDHRGKLAYSPAPKERGDG